MQDTPRLLASVVMLSMFPACGGAGLSPSHVTTVTVKTLELAGNACGLPAGSVLQRFYVVNESRVVRGARLLPDSDQDGVADRDEPGLGTDPGQPRSGSSGCSDRIVQLLAGNAGACTAACGAALAAADNDPNQLLDTDGDTLLDCEEAALGTDPHRADTDGDTLLDGVETRFGTNPMSADTRTADSDGDGVSDAEEIFAGTDPFSAGTPEGVGYTYAPVGASTRGDMACFNYDVDNVDVLPTMNGGNQVCTYVLAGLATDPANVQARRSCVWVKYVE